LLQTCREYSEAFSEKAFCFDDLKDSLRRLDKQHWDEFLQVAEQKQGHFARLFALKVVYSSISGADSEPPHARNQELLALAYRALKLYQLSIAEPPSCPEAALLAALAILQLRIQDPQHQRVLVAVIILEIARSKFEDYYILTVLLVRLQGHLGLLSLAMENFTKLSVKNLQWETVGHLILTRISTLHPAFNGGAGDLEPLLAAETGVTVLENADMALVRGIREGLRFNSYSNIYNSVKMRSEIEQSLNKQICAIEERRVSRWRGSGSDDATILLPTDPSKALVDKRDHSYMPSYCEDDWRVLESCHCGKQPKEGWVNAMVLWDNVTTYLRQDLASHTTLATAAYKNIKQLYERFSADTFVLVELEEEMTSAELSTLDAATNIARAIILLTEGQTAVPSGHPKGSQSLPGTVAHIKSSLTSDLDNRRKDKAGDKDGSTPIHLKIAGSYIPWWSDLHSSFSELEKLQTISHLLTWMSRKLQKGGKNSKTVFGTVGKESVSELQSLVAELEAQIHADARWMKSQINEPGVLGKLVDLGMVRQQAVSDDTEAGKGAWMWDELNSGRDWEQLMESLCDEATMETICGRYRESWDDALDGILVTKVRVVK
jgi:N-terminal acetyltransferase B complex non-catalytic subunit